MDGGNGPRVDPRLDPADVLNPKLNRIEPENRSPRTEIEQRESPLAVACG